MTGRSEELAPDERPTVPGKSPRSGALPLAASLLVHGVLVVALVVARAGRGDLADPLLEEGIPVEIVVDAGFEARLKPIVPLPALAAAPEALKPAVAEKPAKPVAATQAEAALPPAPLLAAPPPPAATALAPPRDAAASAPPLPATARAETVSLAPPELPPARVAEVALPGAAPPVEAPPADQPRIAAAPSAPPPPAAVPGSAPVALTAAAPPPLADPAPLATPAIAPAEAAPARVEEAAPARMAALPPPLPASRAVDPEAEIRAAIGGFDCARIGAKLDGETGALALSGHVRSEGERRRLVEQAAKAAGVARVEASNLRVVGDPYCRVLTFLDDAELARSEDQRQDLAALGSTAEAGIARYAAGSTLELTLNAPDFDSFIYVDYFSSDGRVFHILPAERPDNRFAAEERVVIGGERSRGRRAVIGPPFGLDIVVAIASSEPLFLRPRPATEAAADYLAALDGSIRALRARGFALKLEYAYFLTYTTERAASN